MSSCYITKQRLRELFEYDSRGTFVRRISRGSSRKGDFLIPKCTTRYMSICVDYVSILYHRAVWTYHYGKISDDFEIDHINRNTHDNRIENLRKTKRYQNAQNISLSTRNKSGHRGVSWNSADKRWVAQVHYKQKRYFCKGFSSLEEAAKAAKQARNEIFTHHEGE